MVQKHVKPFLVLHYTDENTNVVSTMIRFQEDWISMGLRNKAKQSKVDHSLRIMTIDLRKIGNQSSAVMFSFINAVACRVSKYNPCRNNPTGRNKRICIIYGTKWCRSWKLCHLRYFHQFHHRIWSRTNRFLFFDRAITIVFGQNLHFWHWFKFIVGEVPFNVHKFIKPWMLLMMQLSRNLSSSSTPVSWRDSGQPQVINSGVKLNFTKLWP